MIASIYALSDPRNPKIPKYIGRTTKPLRRRLNRHKWNAKVRPHYSLSKWVEELATLKMLPVIYLLESVDDANMRERETAWIRFFRPLGTLLNQSDGDGTLGMTHKLPREVYDRAATSKRGRKMPEEQKLRWLNHPKIIQAQEVLKECNRGKMKAVASEDGIWKFESLNEAARVMGVGMANFSVSIRKGWKCLGKAWRLVPSEELVGHKNPIGFDWSAISRQPYRKMFASEYQEVSRLRSAGLSQTEIAKRFHVNQSVISRIINNQHRLVAA